MVEGGEGGEGGEGVEGSATASASAAFRDCGTFSMPMPLSTPNKCNGVMNPGSLRLRPNMDVGEKLHLHGLWAQ